MNKERRRFFKSLVGLAVAVPAIAVACAKPRLMRGIGYNSRNYLPMCPGDLVFVHPYSNPKNLRHFSVAYDHKGKRLKCGTYIVTSDMKIRLATNKEYDQHARRQNV